MKTLLTTFGANITHQKPVNKEFADGLTAEGLDVLATQAGGSGQVWLRGLLLRGDIYILAAWDLKGQVATRPEYVAFFSSFLPGTD